MSSIQQLYIGLLGRAADPAGLIYWHDQIAAGVLSLEQLSANIVNQQPEYLSGVGQHPRETLLESLYQNLFGRSPDAMGVEYWLSGGGRSVNAEQLVLALIHGASGADLQTLALKLEMAQQYTAAADQSYDAREAAEVLKVGSGLVSAPRAIALSNNRLAENEAGAVVGALTVVDQDDHDRHWFELSDARFEVLDGNLKLKSHVIVDYESEQSIALQLTAFDLAGYWLSDEFVIGVENRYDPASVEELVGGAGIVRRDEASPNLADAVGQGPWELLDLTPVATDGWLF